MVSEGCITSVFQSERLSKWKPVRALVSQLLLMVTSLQNKIMAFISILRNTMTAAASPQGKTPSYNHLSRQCLPIPFARRRLWGRHVEVFMSHILYFAQSTISSKNCQIQFQATFCCTSLWVRLSTCRGSSRSLVGLFGNCRGADRVRKIST